MISRAWISEIAVLGLLLLGAVLLGAIFGYPSWFLLLAVALFLGRWMVQLHRLDAWLDSRRRHPPDSWGIWGRVFDDYYRLRRRQHKSKKRLAAVIREFREATAAMPDGTLVLDGDLRIVWCNDAACRLMQLTHHRDLGQPVTNLIRSPRFVSYLNAGDYESAVEIRSPVDEGRHLTLRLVPYGNEQFLLLIRDVTRLHRLQAMRRDFVANASHELRSPLTVLGGYLEALATESVPGTEWHEPLQDMQAQWRRMNNLVGDLLELSRLETEEADAPMGESVDMPTLVRRVARDAEQADGGRHPVEVMIDSDAAVLGVERELYSALSNLITNALRYSPEGSPVQVRWQEGEQGVGAFEVEDRGLGIEAKHLPFITQRFYRVDSSHSRRHGGTGLGLAIVKHVLKRHGARLDVQSEPGEGSVFRCIFPASRVQSAG